ncbi:MAG: hypothetical protein Q9220_004796 [cf. Caloplaca sp. 1 TL-2023]
MFSNELGTLSAFCCLLPIVFFIVKPLSTTSYKNKPRACRKVGSSPRASFGGWRTLVHHQIWRLGNWLRGREDPIAGFVEKLHVHPIKSCRAVELDEAVVLSTGLKYDRQFSFAEYHAPSTDSPSSGASALSGWQFVTQRKYGRLANIQVDIWKPDPKSLDYSDDETNVQSDGVLVVRYPDPQRISDGMSISKQFEVPYKPSLAQIKTNGYNMEKMTIWKDCPDSLLIAKTEQDGAPAWIKEIQAYIGCSKPFALFRVATGHDRQVFRNAPRKEQLGYQSIVGFADSYPLHILGLASAVDLDQKLTEIVPEFSASTALRFRANIYFSGPPAYAEDSWKRIQIGRERYHVACRTTRCELPNTDQSNGKKHLSEPSKTMKSYRDIDEGAGPKKACFGMQMVPASEIGKVKVGDEIKILEIGSHFYIKQ